MSLEEKFDPKIIKNLNKNYELFGKTYSGLFEDLKKKDLDKVCLNTGSTLSEDKDILMSFLNAKLLVSLEDDAIYHYENNAERKNKELGQFPSAIVLHYLNHADGTPIRGEWISYRELPDGLFYSRTIPGVLSPIIEKYPSDFNGLLEVSKAIGGRKVPDIKNSIILSVFERFPVLFVYEPADDEFGADIKILYDRSAHHYIKTDIIKTLTVYLVQQVLG